MAPMSRPLTSEGESAGCAVTPALKIARALGACACGLCLGSTSNQDTLFRSFREIATCDVGPAQVSFWQHERNFLKRACINSKRRLLFVIRSVS